MTDRPTPSSATPPRRRDFTVAAVCVAVIAAMAGLSYAAVPLYAWFCRATGFGGTPQVAAAGPAGVLDRTITVRFDANVAPGLPWRFAPEVTSIDLKLGEVATVYYTITNLAARETAAQAAYNVAPTTVGAYFSKINCFCFTEQRLKPGETRDMAVVFFVDPAMVKDSDQDDLNTITLSYTFYPMRDPQRPVAESAGASGRL